ARMSSTM
ncbi:hypothetical protein BVZ80_00969B, partial [Haemophilus influenzae]